MTAVLEIEGLVKDYPVRRGFWGLPAGRVRALAGVDLTMERGECLGLVGESGSGKTTLGRCALRLVEPTAGRIRFAGEEITALGRGPLRRRRRRFQMVFQDPSGALDPRMRVGRILAEPLVAHRLGDAAARRRRVAELLEEVELPAAAADRYPHQLSGGQRQRVGIGRALASAPELLVADEPVSALDVSVRAQVTHLLARLQDRFGLTLLFIGHDLAVIEQLAQRVAVMLCGRVVEEGPVAAVLAAPRHPYTAALVAAVPVPDPRRRRRVAPPAGDPPSALAPPAGCPYHPRCPIARERCSRERPPLTEVAPGQRAACFYPGELTLAVGAS